MRKCTILFWFCCITSSLQLENAVDLNIATKNFQLLYLERLTAVAEQEATLSLNQYLRDLRESRNFADHAHDMEVAIASDRMGGKILLIKQLLDAKSSDKQKQGEFEDIYVLRNVQFLSKLKEQFQKIQETSEQETRQFQIYKLCKQFRGQGNATKRARLINPESIGAALRHLNVSDSQLVTESSNITQFGNELYNVVKKSGAEIIDNYLHILRAIIDEVIGEKPEDPRDADTVKLTKVLDEIVAMQRIEDFYEKRQRLYACLERNLALDYEQFRNNNAAEEDLAEIMAKLKAKGLDLFMLFLFSNFEFLENVHEHWEQLLPDYAEETHILYEIQQLYDDFKKDTENTKIYDAYVAKVNLLHEKQQQRGERATNNGHIFELLKSAAQNVGSVTFNMIKAKCQEI